MAALKVVVVLACLGATLAGKHEIYSRFQVHRVATATASQHEVLRELEGRFNLDVWEHGVPGDRETVVMVCPENAEAFLDQLDANDIPHTVHLTDVAEMLAKYDAELATWRNGRVSRMPFEDYPRYAEVDAYMESLAAQYPELVSLVTIGPSYEGRDIKYLKVSTTNFTDPSKPIYFLDAMIHAREWVTTPVALYTLHRLVEDLRTEDRDLLEDIDWIILPIVNPDGYEYTHTDERLWRRTRSFNESRSTECYGVDANRNFDINFNTIGVSSDPCSQTYPGTEAFSEPETAYVRDMLFEYLDRIQLYLNIHSYGNWVLYGYGDESLPPNSMQIFHVGAAMGAAIDALKLPQASYYRVGNSGMLLYGTSGSAQDYAQSVGVPFSYTLELPGYNYWFQVPPQYIDQINTETWAGIAASARLARSYYRARL